MRAVTHADDPGAAAAYYSSARTPTRLRNADRARDEMVAALELEDEFADGGELAGFEGED